MKLSDTLLQQEGLSMAHDGATYCGTRGEYTFLILMGRNELVVSVLRGGEEPDKESFRDFVKARPELSGCKTAGTRVIFSLRPGAAAKSYAGKIHTLLPELLSFLHENGYENCCEISHAVGETVGCMTSGVPQLVAPALFTELSRKADQNERIQAETPENIGRGILGALIGGLIGAAAIMRPSKSVVDLETKSVKKKFKDKKFAAGCSREVISQGAEMLGWELDELIERTILAMRSLMDTMDI
mgnify:CR=1 FL=1